MTTDAGSDWSLHFLGVGSSQAVDLGSASVVVERSGQPLLMVDCGTEALSAYLERYGAVPPALFITHAHLDHVGGMERLFGKLWFDEKLRGASRLFVPAALVPILHSRIGDYPGVLAEGGVNFWEAFRFVPIRRGFWLDGCWFDVFPTRHHLHNTSFGLALRGSFVFTGDTRPIPEFLESWVSEGEWVAHDCGRFGNPSHTGLDDLEANYSDGLRSRLLLYHYGSESDAELFRSQGYAVATPGLNQPLHAPRPPAERLDY